MVSWTLVPSGVRSYDMLLIADQIEGTKPACLAEQFDIECNTFVCIFVSLNLYTPFYWRMCVLYRFIYTRSTTWLLKMQIFFKIFALISTLCNRHSTEYTAARFGIKANV
jgi:hypothetical protein